MNLKEQLEESLGETIQTLLPRPGGDAASAFTCTLQNGQSYFVKTVPSGSPFHMEALGLTLLHTSEGIRVPKVIAVGDSFLVLELLTFGPEGPGFQEELGRRLAITHHSCRSEAYGFQKDHWIGATPQKNTPRVPYTPESWSEFWWTHRMEPMVQRLQHPEILRRVSRLQSRLPDLLGPCSETPCLIHGDLWSGNRAADQRGTPVMFDPAPSYSHREAELGMCRMFGGFTETFYRAYDETFPLEEGWRDRQEIYMLYHVLNHAVLFGSGYLRQAIGILSRYV
jgi:fructosamine-3-kinase